MNSAHILIIILLVGLIIICFTNYTHPIQQIDTFNSWGRYGYMCDENCPRHYMCRHNFQTKN